MSNYIIIRHAQSFHNEGSTNNLDSPLTEKGIKQAEMTANALAQYNLNNHVLHVSPFLRTLMTANCIAKKNPNLVIIVDPLISEALSPDYSGVFILKAA